MGDKEAEELKSMVGDDDDSDLDDIVAKPKNNYQNPVLRIRNKIWVFMDVPTSSKPVSFFFYFL